MIKLWICTRRSLAVTRARSIKLNLASGVVVLANVFVILVWNDNMWYASHLHHSVASLYRVRIDMMERRARM